MLGVERDVYGKAPAQCQAHSSHCTYIICSENTSDGLSTDCVPDTVLSLHLRRKFWAAFLRGQWEGFHVHPPQERCSELRIIEKVGPENEFTEKVPCPRRPHK